MNHVNSSSARCFGITYIDGSSIDSITIATIPGQEEALFGPACGALVKDLWKSVSEPGL